MKLPSIKENHLKPAAGDNYGMGYKAKIGKTRGDTVGIIPVTKRQLATPPKSTT